MNSDYGVKVAIGIVFGILLFLVVAFILMAVEKDEENILLVPPNETQVARLSDSNKSCDDSKSADCEQERYQNEMKRWKKLGPGGGGWFMHQAIGPDGLLLVAADVGGLHLSKDSGGSWEQLGFVNGLTDAASTHISAVAFHPTDPDIFFAGARGGIFRTVDGGKTFTNVEPNGGRICAIAIGKTRSFASIATAFNQDCNEILVSDGSGTKWRSAGFLPDNTHVMNIRINPSNSNKALFISQKGRFFNYESGVLETLHETTADADVNFNQVDLNGLPVYDAVWSNDGQRTFITTREFDSNQDGIGDGGESDGVRGAPVGQLIEKDAGYDSPQTVLSTDYTGMIWIPSGIPGIVIRLVDRRSWGTWMAKEGMYESTNLGTTFTKISSVADHDLGWSEAEWAYQTRSVKEWSFSQFDPDTALYSTNQFVRGSFDGGQTFTELSTERVSESTYRTTGLDNTIGKTVVQHPLNSDLVWFGYGDLGCFKSKNAGDTWEICNPPESLGGWNDGHGGFVRAIVLDPADESKIWMSSGKVHSYMVKSTEGGDKGSWFGVTSGLPAPADYVIDDIILDPDSPPGFRHLLAAVDGDIYRSVDDGVTWSEVFACGDCYRLEIDPQANIALAGGESGLYYSNSNGSNGSWVSVVMPGFSGSSGIKLTQAANRYKGVQQITNDPRNPGVFWIAARGSENGIFKYDNGVVTRVLTATNARTIAVDPVTNYLYAGFSEAFGSGGYDEGDGVLYSDDDGISWNELETPFANKAAWFIYIPESDSNTKWIQNPGNGFWKYDTTPVKVELNSQQDSLDEVFTDETFTFDEVFTPEYWSEKEGITTGEPGNPFYWAAQDLYVTWFENGRAYYRPGNFAQSANFFPCTQDATCVDREGNPLSRADLAPGQSAFYVYTDAYDQAYAVPSEVFTPEYWSEKEGITTGEPGNPFYWAAQDLYVTWFENGRAYYRPGNFAQSANFFPCTQDATCVDREGNPLSRADLAPGQSAFYVYTDAYDQAYAVPSEVFTPEYWSEKEGITTGEPGNPFYWAAQDLYVTWFENGRAYYRPGNFAQSANFFPCTQDATCVDREGNPLSRADLAPGQSAFYVYTDAYDQAFSTQ